MRPAYWAAPAFSRRCRCSRGVLLSAPSPAASAVPSGSADTALASVAFLGSAAAVVWVLRSARASASVPSVSAGAALGSVAAVLCRAFQVPFFYLPLPAYFASHRVVLCFVRSCLLLYLFRHASAHLAGTAVAAARRCGMHLRTGGMRARQARRGRFAGRLHSSLAPRRWANRRHTRRGDGGRPVCRRGGRPSLWVLLPVV